MANWILYSRFQNALDHEINFLNYLNVRKGVILKYARLKVKMDENSFATALNISKEELKRLEKESGTLPPQLIERLKMLF